MLLDILQPLIRSKRILWEVALEDVECIQARKCLAVYPFHRVQTLRLDGDFYDFGCREKTSNPLRPVRNRLSIPSLSLHFVAEHFSILPACF